jgi:hypothetical protein
MIARYVAGYASVETYSGCIKGLLFIDDLHIKVTVTFQE